MEKLRENNRGNENNELVIERINPLEDLAD